MSANLGMRLLRWMEMSELTDAQRDRLRPQPPPQEPPTTRPANNHRAVISGILWVLCTGYPWRGLSVLRLLEDGL